MAEWISAPAHGNDNDLEVHAKALNSKAGTSWDSCLQKENNATYDWKIEVHYINMLFELAADLFDIETLL